MDDASTSRPPASADSGRLVSDTSLGVTGRRLLGYLWPQRLALAIGIGAFFLAAALEPLVPALLKHLLDNGFQSGSAIPLWSLPAVVVGLFVLRGMLTFSGAYLFAWATSKAVLALRHDLVGAIIHADASLFVTLSPGVATARVINEPQNAVAALTQAFTTILRDGTSLVALMGYLFWLNWKLTLVSLVTVPLLAYVVRRVQRRIIEMGGRTYESQIRLTGIIDDIARAWRVVRTFDAGDFEQRRFDDEAYRLRRRTVKSAAAGALMTPLTQTVASIGVAIILTLAVLQSGSGGTTVGEFVAFITALLMTIAPLKHLTDVTQPIATGLIQARACFALIDTPPEPDTGSVELQHARGELRLAHATVVYPGAARPALDAVDLTIPAGRTVALVGPSGSGKTTLVNTLLGFVAPTAGSVTIDGVDLSTVRKSSLRRQFAVVSQDIVLFDGTIEDNVVYAQPKDPARVEECLRAAQLWDLVLAMPDGVHAVVGTNGSRLSGGQRQRLAIARALYKDAPIWIFDEATSALDSASEQAVHEALERWRGERTLILIAHRLSTVRHADAIYVLADNRLAEVGRHEDLMAAGALYAGMVRAQTVH